MRIILIVAIAVLFAFPRAAAQTRPISPEGDPFGIVLHGGAAPWPGSDLILLWSTPDDQHAPNVVATLDQAGIQIRLEIVAVAVLDPRPCAINATAGLLVPSCGKNFEPAVVGQDGWGLFAPLGVAGPWPRISPVLRVEPCNNPRDPGNWKTDLVASYFSAGWGIYWGCPGEGANPLMSFILARPQIIR